MRSLFLTLTFLTSLNLMAMSPMLEPLAASIDKCKADTGVLLCQEDLAQQVTSMDLNARGELVYLLKSKMENSSKEVIVNLYSEFKKLIPIYEELDGCDKWSCRDAKEFVGDISIEYVKVADINAKFLINLFKEQSVQSGRYGVLVTVHGRSKSVESLSEINEVTTFAEFAKEYVRQMGDEYYLYESAVDLVKKMTTKAIALNPKHEGIYSISFIDADINARIKINTIAVMKSNSAEGLVITLNDSRARLEKFVFNQAGILGNTLFSNEDVYTNQLDFSGTSIRFTLDHATGSIKGIFNSERFGAAEFVGQQISGTHNVLNNGESSDLKLKDLLGSYKVKVAGIGLNLVVRKRSAVTSKIEGALYNNNVLISFSRVTFYAARGTLEMVDSQNKRKLTLNVVSGPKGLEFSGVLFNVIMSKMMPVSSL